MLTAMRKGSKSKVMQILLGLIALSFVGFFGVSGSGGHGGNRGGTDDGVAQVGDVDIAIADIARAFSNEVQTLQQRLGTTINPVQAQQLGLLDVAINRLVSSTLFSLGAEDLGIVATDDQVREFIFTAPQFTADNGDFDRVAFDVFLLRGGMAEAQFVELLRNDLRRRQLLDTIGAGGLAPESMVDALYDYRQERRVADVIVISNADVTDIGVPDDAAIATYYQTNLGQFLAPEYRAISIASLTLAALADTVAVPEEDILAEYEFRLDSLTLAEARVVEQALFLDAASAREAADRIAGGEGFAAVAEAITGLGSVPLGFVVDSDLPSELAGPVFRLAAGSISEPLESPLGWHLLYVKDIQESVVTPLEEVRDEIRDALAIGLARDEIFEVLNVLEDTLAGGASLEEAARGANLTMLRLDGISAGGADRAGALVSVDALREVVTAAFTALEGDDPTVVETDEGGFFALRVDRVIPPVARPLDEVREGVIDGWQRQQRQEAAQAQARDIVDRITGGGEIYDVAGDFDLFAESVGPFTRTGDGADLPGEFIAAAFEGAIGDISLTPAPGGFVVGRLTQVQLPNPSDDLTGFVGFQDNLDRLIAADLQIQLSRALENRFEVDVDRQALQDLADSGRLVGAAGGLGGGGAAPMAGGHGG